MSRQQNEEYKTEDVTDVGTEAEQTETTFETEGRRQDTEGKVCLYARSRIEVRT